MSTDLGKFIVIDGMDGSGKGTQIKLLQERLQGHPVIFTREPGGTPKAEEIRIILLGGGSAESDPLRDSDLFWEARESHIEELIGPSLAQGIHAVCDRYDSSTFTFQICAEQQESLLLERFKKKREGLPIRYHPHLYIILDMPVDVAVQRRLRDATQEKTRFDLKEIEYHERVRNGFRRFDEYLRGIQTRSVCCFIDANRPLEEVHADIWSIVSKTLGL